MESTVETRIPAYHRIMNELREAIRSGALKPGDPVGSERDLAGQFGVSLMTARHALKEMEVLGLVVRRSRVGTFVAPPRIQFNKLLGFTEQTASKGFAARSRVVSVRFVEDDAEIPPRLALPSFSRLIRIERVRIANEKPFAVETCFLSAEQFPGLSEQALERRSLFTILEGEYGVGLAYADEEVDATSADPRSAQLLEVPRGAPVLRIRQVLYSADGKPVAYSFALYRAEQHSLVIRRFR